MTENMHALRPFTVQKPSTAAAAGIFAGVTIGADNGTLAAGTVRVLDDAVQWEAETLCCPLSNVTNAAPAVRVVQFPRAQVGAVVRPAPDTLQLRIEQLLDPLAVTLKFDGADAEAQCAALEGLLKGAMLAECRGIDSDSGDELAGDSDGDEGAGGGACPDDPFRAADAAFSAVDAGFSSGEAPYARKRSSGRKSFAGADDLTELRDAFMGDISRESCSSAGDAAGAQQDEGGAAAVEIEELQFNAEQRQQQKHAHSIHERKDEDEDEVERPMAAVERRASGRKSFAGADDLAEMREAFMGDISRDSCSSADDVSDQ
eukprot:g4240.t1